VFGDATSAERKLDPFYIELCTRLTLADLERLDSLLSVFGGRRISTRVGRNAFKLHGPTRSYPHPRGQISTLLRNRREKGRVTGMILIGVLIRGGGGGGGPVPRRALESRRGEKLNTILEAPHPHHRTGLMKPVARQGPAGRNKDVPVGFVPTNGGRAAF